MKDIEIVVKVGGEFLTSIAIPTTYANGIPELRARVLTEYLKQIQAALENTAL